MLSLLRVSLINFNYNVLILSLLLLDVWQRIHRLSLCHLEQVRLNLQPNHQSIIYLVNMPSHLYVDIQQPQQKQ